MLRKTIAALLSLLALIAMPTAASARLQCVAYARQASAGAVLAFAASHAMPMGHVAVVSKVIDARHILLNHANWSRPGMVERGVLAVDVSEAGDWSSVRVWYAPTHALGLREVTAHGFIYPANAEAETAHNTSSTGTDTPTPSV